MLIGLNGATTMGAELEVDVQVAGQAGYDLLEIWSAKLDVFLKSKTVENLGEILAQAKVRPYSINSIEQITFQDAAGYEAIVRRCHYLCHIAQALACPYVVVVPSDKPKGVSRREIFAESVRVLRELAAVALGYDVGLAFEFIGQPNRTVSNLADCRRIVEQVDRPNVGLVIDTFHFYAGDSTVASIRKIDPRKLFILHINDAEDRPKSELTDAHRLFPGQGVIPLRPIIRALRKVGYDRMASIELFRPEYWQWEPLRVAEMAKARTQEVLGLQ
ncbi:MAG: sugar phosphate isomerase/epimerase [Chloroflexota bacterium]